MMAAGHTVLGLPPRALGWAIAAGVVVGAAYALSPLTIWFALAMVILVRWTTKELTGSERRWIVAVLLVAIVLRVVAVAVLFASTDHTQVPFGVFFGDEEYYIRRSIWMRNIWLGLPLHTADLIYLFDETGLTSHLNVLAFLQILVGPAPYGVHLVGIAFYLAACVLLYRTAREAFGRMPALIGLILVLFLPSLFAWSISALKEPLFFLLTASSIVLTTTALRQNEWSARLLPAAAVVALGFGLATLRQGGGFLSAAGVLGGVALALLVSRPRLLLATAIAVPIVVGAGLSRPEAQVKAYGAIQAAARQHWGHVATPGYVYRVLDPRFYPDSPDFAGRAEINDMNFGEAVRFVVRSIERYVTVPLPWEVQSRSALLYVPEQIVWYVLVLLAPAGIVLAMRRDSLVASLLVAQALIAAMTVALTSGNVGTLVRHRGLALPYVLWLSAVAFCEFVWRLRRVAPETGWPAPPPYSHEQGAPCR
jgi:dolichyl-phosphate-mannose-protein mannosyltransferase